MLGYELDELDESREAFIELLHPDDVVMADAKMKRHIELEEPYDFEIRMRHKDGHYVDIRTRGQIYRDEDGLPLYLSGSHTDITDRKRYEKELAESELKFRDFAGVSADRFWEMDSQFRFTYVSENHSGKRIKAPYMIGKTRWELYGSDINDPVWEEHAATLATHEAFGDFIYSRTLDDGSEIWIKSSGKPIFDDQNQFIGYRGTNLDITDEITASMARDESEKKFRTLFEMASDAMFVIDPANMTIVDANEIAAKQRGYSVQELTALKVPDINEIEPSEHIKSLYDNLHQQPHMTYESIHKRKDGSTFPVEINLHLIELEGRELIQSIARDITLRKEVDRMKDEFIAIASHELRTPLTSIMGAIGLVKEGTTGEQTKESKDLLDIAYYNCERLSLLVNNLLDLSKFESGNIIVDLGSAEAIVLRNASIRGETFRVNERIRAYVENVSQERKGPQIFLSRTAPEFMAKLLKGR